MKKKIFLLIIVTFVGIFAFNSSVYAKDVYCAALPDAVIDESIPNLVSTIIKVIQIVVPILLVVLGMIDFLKGVMAQKEDEIKKGQQTFIKRAIAGILVFFVIAIVKFLFSQVSGDGDMMSCVSCFLNGANDSSCTPAGANQ